MLRLPHEQSDFIALGFKAESAIFLQIFPPEAATDNPHSAFVRIWPTFYRFSGGKNCVYCRNLPGVHSCNSCTLNLTLNTCPPFIAERLHCSSAKGRKLQQILVIPSFLAKTPLCSDNKLTSCLNLTTPLSSGCYSAVTHWNKRENAEHCRLLDSWWILSSKHEKE